MHASHSPGFVHMRHTSFRQFSSLPLQSLAARPPNPPPVGVYLLLLIGFPFPLPRASLRLGNVAAAVGLVQTLHHGSAVVTLVRYRFLNAAQIDLRLFRWSRHCFVLNQLRDRFARFCQSLVNGRGVALIDPLQRHRQQGAAGQVHSMFGSYGFFHSLLEPFFFRLRSNRASCSRVGFSIPAALAKSFRYSSYFWPLSRRTRDRSAALASSVVASMETVFPSTKPSSARIFSTHWNTALCVSTANSRRVREMLE